MAQDWYCRIDGAQCGPLTGTELKKLARAGTLKPDDPVRQSSSERWVPAVKVKGLFAEAERTAEQRDSNRLLTDTFGIPESILRDSVVFPLSKVNGVITLLAEEPDDSSRQKLEFILNTGIQLVAAPRGEILEHIERCCGKIASPPQASGRTDPSSTAGVVTSMVISVDEIARIDAAMGELHLQCPKCGHRERVNDAGKLMLHQGRNVFARYSCPGCKHVYDGAAHLFSGNAPVEAGTLVTASPSIQSHAIEVEDTPAPKKPGPSLWTSFTRPFAISGYAAKIAAKVRDTHPHRPSGLYDHEEYLRRLGEEIHAKYGFQGMVDVFNSVRQRKGTGPMSELTRIWNNVGDWQA